MQARRRAHQWSDGMRAERGGVDSLDTHGRPEALRNGLTAALGSALQQRR
jgi:hypothetical protein